VTLGVTPFDFARTPELIDQAYHKTLDWIADGGLDKRAIPNALRPHWHTSAGVPRPPIEWLDQQGRKSTGRRSFVDAAPDGRAAAVN
jgi:hypothetical protein